MSHIRPNNKKTKNVNIMRVVFTYLPIRLKEVTEIYLKYSIGNLNNQNIVPTIYSDKDYFIHTDLKYRWIEFDVNSKYKVDTLWSYPKLKVLSMIDRPFIHLDNDLIVEDFSKLMNLIKPILYLLYYLFILLVVHKINIFMLQIMYLTIFLKIKKKILMNIYGLKNKLKNITIVHYLLMY